MTGPEGRKTGRIIVSADMLKAALGLKRRGKIPPAEALERVKQSRASLAVAGNPLAHKPSPPIANPNDPTPQWIAKAGRNLEKVTIGAGEVTAKKLHRSVAPMQKQIEARYPPRIAIAYGEMIEGFLQSQRIATALAVSGSPGFACRARNR